MKNFPRRPRSRSSLSFVRRYIALALCALALTFVTASSLAQRRVAVRVTPGEATPATPAPAKSETERERERERAARLRASTQRKRIDVSRPGPRGGAQVGVPTTGALG